MEPKHPHLVTGIASTVIAVALVAAGVSYVVGKTGAAKPPRHLSVDSPSHDFGQVASGTPLRCHFRITNRGGVPIEIESVKTSCGCIAHHVDGQSLDPGEISSLSVQVNTFGIQPPDQINKVIRVTYTVEGQTHQLPLTVLADLRPDVGVEPKQLTFSATEHGERQSCELRIRREMLDAEQFARLRIDAPPAYYIVKELDRSRDEFRVAINLVEEIAPTYPRSLRLCYDGPTRQAKVIHVPVTRPTNGHGVAVAPCSYFVSVKGEDASGDLRQLTTRTMRLNSQFGHKLVITSIRPRKPDAEQMFEWQVLGKSPGEFQIWAKALPQDSEIVSSEFVVTYQDEGRKMRGELKLNAYLLAPDGMKTASAELDVSPGT